MANLTIPIPELEPEAPVWLHFNGAMIPSYIKVRAWFPERSAWYYRVALSGQWHQAREFTPRICIGIAHNDELIAALDRKHNEELMAALNGEGQANEPA